MKFESMNQPGELWISTVTSPDSILKVQCCQQRAGCCQRISAPVFEPTEPNT